MRLEARKYLYDIQNAIAMLEEFTAGKALADYEREPMMRSAVERKLEIIGEALAQLAKFDAETANGISEYQRIIAFRNILIHGYTDVVDRLVWDVIETKLPILSREVEALLRSE
jgi:uncharacterized protein with HEPN domain